MSNDDMPDQIEPEHSRRVISALDNPMIEELLAIVYLPGMRIEPLPLDSLPPYGYQERWKRVVRSAAWVDQTMQEVERAAAEGLEPTAYYGINTGFGDNAGRATFRSRSEAAQLSRKLLLSHAIGVGEHLPYDVVRAALAIRIFSLSKGYSGVRVEVINTLIAMVNKGVYPAVPSQGSLGASGDLAPLAHLVLPLSKPLPDEPTDLPGATGYCYLDGKLVTGAEAMAAAGIPQIELGAKEGVALINGTAISLAISLLAEQKAGAMLSASLAAVALSVEAMRGFRDAFLPHVHRLRNSQQADIAEKILVLLQGSTLVRGDADIDLPSSDGPPQDPYSLRCAPVVLSAANHADSHVYRVLADELRAVTDNPLIFANDEDELPRQTKVISGGNFHGEPIALVMDYLSTAMAEVANIAERRIFLLTDPRLNRGLPPFLIPDQTGLNSGLMIAQYTAASLVSENKSLAHPASVDSIPSSANREDHVSMSTIAARKAAQIVENCCQVVALELLTAAQALELRMAQFPDLKAGEGSARILAIIRNLEIAPGKKLELIRADVPLGPYVKALADAVKASAFAVVWS
ncbi:MAG: aromatic amino acid lyase [Anaerolineae bacterium]|nr:aromatic amino acid lyase [Anaerolineae bacterium]